MLFRSRRIPVTPVTAPPNPIRPVPGVPMPPPAPVSFRGTTAPAARRSRQPGRASVIRRIPGFVMPRWSVNRAWREKLPVEKNCNHVSQISYCRSGALKIELSFGWKRGTRALGPRVRVLLVRAGVSHPVFARSPAAHHGMEGWPAPTIGIRQRRLGPKPLCSRTRGVVSNLR